MTRRLSAVALVLALALTAACGKNLNLFERSPGDTVRALYTACNEARYSEVEPLFSDNVRALMKTPQAVATGGVKKACDRASHDGTIAKIEIVKEEVRGEGAVVTANISFKDGPPLEGDRTDLIKEGGAWRITGATPERASTASSGLATAKLIIQASPDLELVSTNEAAGTVTVRNKRTNEVITVSIEDVKNGKFRFSGR
jgi:Domain of unknown function (DUF4878)